MYVMNMYIKAAGLKPPAVTDTPMDPRVFIVNRAGDATEVVSDGLLTNSLVFMCLLVSSIC